PLTLIATVPTGASTRNRSTARPSTRPPGASLPRDRAVPSSSTVPAPTVTRPPPRPSSHGGRVRRSPLVLDACSAPVTVARLPAARSIVPPRVAPSTVSTPSTTSVSGRAGPAPIAIVPPQAPAAVDASSRPVTVT